MFQTARCKCLGKNSYFFPFLGDKGNSVTLNATNRDLKLPSREKKTRYAAICGAGNTDILHCNQRFVGELGFGQMISPCNPDSQL